MDRGYARTSIGGELDAADVKEFLQLLADEGFEHFRGRINAKTTLEELLKNSEGGWVSVCTDSAPDGHNDMLEQWLTAHALAFDTYSGVVASYGPTVVMERPGHPRLCYDTGSMEDTLVPADAVLKAYNALREGNVHNALTYLANTVGSLAALPPLPPFTVKKKKRGKAAKKAT